MEVSFPGAKRVIGCSLLLLQKPPFWQSEIVLQLLFINGQLYISFSIVTPGAVNGHISGAQGELGKVRKIFIHFRGTVVLSRGGYIIGESG